MRSLLTASGPHTDGSGMKKGWIIDLQSFVVEAETEEDAIEEALKLLKREGAKIDKVLPCEDY